MRRVTRAVSVTAAACLTTMGVVMAANAGASGYDPCDAPLPTGSEPVDLDPADFVESIDNTNWPMTPGTRWVYAETDARGDVAKVDVRVKERTKEILGITATVVRDTVTEQGELVEDTRDWFAQDVCGNIWYLGENSKEYEDGTFVSTAGSWKAGKDGAQAGVVMPGAPIVGMSYRQEYLAGEAEDAATVISTGDQTRVPYGHVDEVLVTKDYTPLVPRVLEFKFYAPGIGPVEEISLSGGSDRAELLRFNPGS